MYLCHYRTLTTKVLIAQTKEVVDDKCYTYMHNRNKRTLIAIPVNYVDARGGWWSWALVSPDGVAPSQMVSVSASVNLPLHHKVQKFSSGTGSRGWSRKKGHKTVVVVVVC